MHSADFTNRADTARFCYSLDGQSWHAIGHDLKMAYSLAHFVGYRLGLFNYATKTPAQALHTDFAPPPLLRGSFCSCYDPAG